MTKIEYSSLREKLYEEKAKLTLQLEQIQRALNELPLEPPSNPGDVRPLVLDQSDNIATGTLDRRPTVLPKRAESEAISAEFQVMTDDMFKRNDELFRKLAQ